MIVRRVVIPLLALGALAGATSEPATSSGPAWSESFTMQLREKTRTFVVHAGVAYLAMHGDDLADSAFLAGKDVMLAGKFERGDGVRAWFYGYDPLTATGLSESWATRLEGDNVYVFGRIVSTSSGLELRVAAVALGESDAQIIARRVEQVPASDHPGRLQVAAWVRKTGEKQGNSDFWTAAADTIVTQTVEAAAKDAAAIKDAKLLTQAVGWSLDLLDDPVVAARVASQPWLFDAGGPESEVIAKRLRALRYDYYKGKWRSRPESLGLQFDDRFASTAWRDADAYYKLGRWVEANAEELPRARELSHRCYQAGFRADPAHNGIRREMGLGPVAADGNATRTLEGAFQDPAGVTVDGPEGWTRAPAINGDATWNDPRSETAYISARVLTENELSATFAETWAAALSPYATRPGFTAIEEALVEVANGGEGKRVRFSYREGRYTRFAEVILAWQPAVKAAAILSASYTEAEQKAASEALSATLAKLTFPAAPVAAPAPTGATTPMPTAPVPMPAVSSPAPGGNTPAPAAPRPGDI